VASSSPPQPPPGGFETIGQRFRVLSDPTRLHILYELMQGPRSVTELTEAIGASQPNISRHLSTLLKEGLVGRERRGSFVVYAVEDPSVFELCELVCGSIQRRIDAQQRALTG
jgi:DNA-binding transcriptional ArsR family regulator